MACTRSVQQIGFGRQKLRICTFSSIREVLLLFLLIVTYTLIGLIDQWSRKFNTAYVNILARIMKLLVLIIAIYCHWLTYILSISNKIILLGVHVINEVLTDSRWCTLSVTNYITSFILASSSTARAVSLLLIAFHINWQQGCG